MIDVVITAELTSDRQLSNTDSVDVAEIAIEAFFEDTTICDQGAVSDYNKMFIEFEMQVDSTNIQAAVEIAIYAVEKALGRATSVASWVHAEIGSVKAGHLEVS